jgi:hypothetical protein
VDADLDTFATALYVTVDDRLKTHPELVRWRPEVGFSPQLSDAELVTLAVLQSLGGFVSEARFVRYARRHLVHLFPYLPGQSGYNKALKKAAPLLAELTRLSEARPPSPSTTSGWSTRRRSSAPGRARR